MGFENPRWRQMQAADQARFVGVKADRNQIDLEAFGLEQEAGARDRQFADPALPEAAAGDDALGIGPGPGLEKALGDISEFLCEFLDRAMYQRRGADIVADQRLIERVLADGCGGLSPNGSSPFFFSGPRNASGISRNAPLLARSPR